MAELFRVRFVRGYPPYVAGDEAGFPEAEARGFVEIAKVAEYRDTVEHPPVEVPDASGPQRQDAAADAGPPSPPTSAAPARVVSMGGRRRR